MKKKNKKSKKKFKKAELYQAVLNIFRRNPRGLFNYKQISHQLQSNSPEMRQQVGRVLKILEKEDIIEQVRPGKFSYIPEYSLLTGTIEMTGRGVGFVYNEEFEQDIRINPSLTNKAFHGDTVTVELLSQKGGKRQEGRVVEIIERQRHQFVGTVEKLQKFAFVIPDSNKIHVDFFIKQRDLNGAEDGDKVIIELLEWAEKFDQPQGKVIEVLGQAGENDTEMHAIVAEFGFETCFSPRALKESLQCPEIISEAEISKRRDMRGTTTFTIDPADAKDFDDAISFKVLDDGNLEIGVHIADVSHYVKKGTALDQDAYDRATSVYLVDRTIPMLPERLSNDLCSLKPEIDRLAFSVIFKMNKEGRVLDYWIGKSVIHSNRRFAYEEAQEVIEGRSEEMKDIIPLLNDIAIKLRTKRFEAGSISFESDEFRFDLDEKGVPLTVYKKVRFDAHKLIEEFMLLANRTVAEHVFKKMKKAPIPYRVHEPPNPEKLEPFIAMAKKFGYRIEASSDMALAQSINKMVEETEGKMEASLLHPLAIRSMEKAYYTTEDTSHFGLHFDYYTHFTSPIRRYPDLILHRQLMQYLDGKLQADQGDIEKRCRHSSKQEEKAAKAERASIKYKQVEYLSRFEGQRFEGVVSGVTDWGLYVELVDNHCEGMIRIKDLEGDFYEFYEREFSIIGRRTKKKYTLGDPLTVIVKKTNLHKRTVDLVIAS